MSRMTTVISYDVGYEKAVEGKTVQLTLGIDGPVVGEVRNIRRSGDAVIGDVVIIDGCLKSVTDQSLDLFSVRSCSIIGKEGE